MRHVLVVQLARIGDILQTKRLLLSIAAEQNTQVHLCIDPTLLPLAALVYPFAMLHPVPAHAGAGQNAGAVLSLAAKTFATLRSICFTQVYMLNASPLSLAMAELFDPAQIRGFAVNKGQAVRDHWCLMASRWMRDRQAAPLNLVDYWAYLHPTPIAPGLVNPVPQRQGTHRIGIVLAGRQARRSLPAPVLAACVQAVFQAQGGPTLVFLGTKAERPAARQLARHLSPPAAQKIEDTTGQTNLTDLPHLLLGLDLLLTPDTGTMHLAAHLGIPVQAFFLSSAWCFETGPYGLGHKIWQSSLPCGPCLETAPCPNKVACLEGFTNTAFLEHLAGKHTPDWPTGLLGCITGFDSLGQECKIVDGQDIAKERRQGLRASLGAYLGIPAGAVPAHATPLYKEQDWMLPARGRPSTLFE